MLLASTGLPSSLRIVTGVPEAATARTKTAAGGACSPTGDATVTRRSLTRTSGRNRTLAVVRPNATSAGTDRSNVSRMLAAARDRGIVQVRIIDPVGRDNDLEEQFAERFGLEAVRVAANRARPGGTRAGRPAELGLAARHAAGRPHRGAVVGHRAASAGLVDDDR